MTDPVYTAMARIHAIIAEWSHPKSDMTNRNFINEVMAAVDDKEVVNAVRAATGADSPDAPLSPNVGDAPVSTP